jgi:two-component system sensor histidine kinase/response regulator
LKALIIDDDPTLARALQRLLRSDEVATEGDPRRAVERMADAEADGAPFEVVLCDFDLGEMTGIDVLARLTSLAERPAFVLMSGYEEIVDAASTADAVLLKPFRATEIRELLARIKVTRSRAVTRRIRTLAGGTQS